MRCEKGNTQHHDRAVIELRMLGNLLVVNYEQFVHEFQMVGEVGETSYIDDSDSRLLDIMMNKLIVVGNTDYRLNVFVDFSEDAWSSCLQ